MYVCIYIYIYIYIYISIYPSKAWHLPTGHPRCQPDNKKHIGTVSSHNSNSQKFKLRVSNPETIAYVHFKMPFECSVQIPLGLGPFFEIELSTTGRRRKTPIGVRCFRYRTGGALVGVPPKVGTYHFAACYPMLSQDVAIYNHTPARAHAEVPCTAAVGAPSHVFLARRTTRTARRAQGPLRRGLL